MSWTADQVLGLAPDAKASAAVRARAARSARSPRGSSSRSLLVREDPVLRWLARVAEVLRRNDTDVSTAHVIEAGHTAQALAALRGRPLAGLPEITDALGAVLGEGAGALLALLREELVIGEELGSVAENHDHAAFFAALGAPAFACTPDQFPDLIAAAIERRDVGAWAADAGIGQ